MTNDKYEILIIRHLGATNGDPGFHVARADGKTGVAVTLPPPESVQVEGRPNSSLPKELRWYLEQFLDCPVASYTGVAERVQDALKRWGESVFSALFQGQALLWYDLARQAGLANLHLKIAADDPRILAWPWEALRDPEGATLAHACRIERQLNRLHDPLPLPQQLPRDCINILLVIARPGGEKDVGYHALARPLVELSRQASGRPEQTPPVRVDVLRPPAFEQLRRTLRAKKDFYHIVHFDGHGGYGDSGPPDGGHSFQGPQGRLLFENEQGGADAIEAERLTQLLSDFRLPLMVLNACQSARIDERAEDAFASIAAALLKAGIRGVVAMGYNLYVSGAQRFVPAFYQNLFESGSVAEAVRAGRQAMRASPERVCVLGEHPLQDWLVPVLYQQEPVEMRFEKSAAPLETAVQLPPEALEQGDCGFIGREGLILALERALLPRQPQAAVLIHGMAGVGKTTAAQGMARWLCDTDGLQAGLFWFRFDDLRDIEYMVNRLVEALFDTRTMALPLEQKQAALLEKLHQTPFLLVWDNFESAAGIANTEVTPQLSDADRQWLKKLLKNLRGGRTKILITSRSPETWLSPQECYRLPLTGLQGEERWAYCNAVLLYLRRHIERQDRAAYAELMDFLDGHPLAMRAVLPRLLEESPAALLAALQQRFSAAAGEEESTLKIHAALELSIQALPVAHAPLLRLLGLHQRYVDTDCLVDMLKSAGADRDRTSLEACISTLETGGLLHHQGQGIYAMHPALSGWLRQYRPAEEQEQRGFVDIMGRLADALAPRQLHEQRLPFYLHGANFHHALDLAGRLRMDIHLAALTQALAAFAQHNRDFGAARRLFEALAKHESSHENQEGLADAYHQLGIIAQEQRDFQTAEQWYKKSLAIDEKQGNEHGAAKTCHQLGSIAQEQRDFRAAEQWCKKSLAIKEKQGNKHGAATTCHQLGIIAQKQRDFQAAKQWYKKSLAIKEKQGNEHGAANTCHQLGRIAEEQRDFQAAEQWYKKSLAIKEKQGNEHGAAGTYHQMGMIAEKKGEIETAAAWYLRALVIFLRVQDPHNASIVADSYVRLLGQANAPVRAALRQGWQAAGLEEQFPFNELEKQASSS
ncbi:MAG: tetratricopeptide repeat protein [Gammaproteobacteria bacterium]|nr:tetratricopeptide repeat protein [Gammaproteobacteria bacterium]